jgi:hypothetical protein
MTLLTLSSPNDIKGCLKTLQPSPAHPLILSSSHPLILSSSHPLILSSSKNPSPITITTSFLSNPAPTTGHLTLLFNLPTPLALSSRQFGASSKTIATFLSNLGLISCTPSLILGTLAFRDASENLAAAYLSILSNYKPKGVSNGHWEEQIIVPRPGVREYYFLGREVVRLGCGRFWEH